MNIDDYVDKSSYFQSFTTANALRVRQFRERQAAKKAIHWQVLNSTAADILRGPIPLESPGTPTPVSIDHELHCDYKCWPRRRMFVHKPCSSRLRILQAAFKSMSKKVLYRKGVQEKRPTGLWFKWHYQVFLFLKLQIKKEHCALRGQDLFTGITPRLQSRKLLA